MCEGGIGRGDGCFVALSGGSPFEPFCGCNICQPHCEFLLGVVSGTICRWPLWVNCQISLKPTILMGLNYFMESVEIRHR